METDQLSAWAMVKHKILTRNKDIFAIFFFNQQLTFFYQENTQGTAVPHHCQISAPEVQVQTPNPHCSVPISQRKGRAVSA